MNATAWRQWLPGLLVLSALLVLMRDTATAMVQIWIRSGTFQHAFLVVPIVAWLVWRRRAELARLPIRPVPWMLVPIGAACLLWLLGEAATVAAASQFALVSLVVLSVPALFGWDIARAFTFPLLFLYFAVPIGDFAVPKLQDWTADVTVWALRVTGIPVYREGNQFIIPTGTWSVVEACSGIRYLIACFMVGALFAHLNFRSARRRVVFMVAAIAVPIAANWVRAYSIVMIGHLTGSPMILGVEHTTYGWFLFGAIVLILFAVASRWTETEAAPGSASVSREVAVAPGSAQGQTAIVIAIAALVAAAQVWAARLEPPVDAVAPSVTLPEALGAWRRQASEPPLRWNPGFVNPSIAVAASYSDGGRPVTVWVGYYRYQNAERKLVTSVHRVVASGEEKWRYLAQGTRDATSELPPFLTGVISPGVAPTLTDTGRDRAWYVYWPGGRWTVSPQAAKLWQALDRLRGRGDDGAVVLLVTELDEAADDRLEKFARSQMPSIAAALAAARGTR